MKKFPGTILFLLLLTFGCKEEEQSDFTGSLLTYPLAAGAEYNTSGIITFKEKVDGTLQVSITIGPTGEDILHPAHLHYGAYSNSNDAEMAAMLEPVNGLTGKSTTNLARIADGTELDFDRLKNFNGHIKIHGDDGPNKAVILAYGNIGANGSPSTETYD